MPNTTFFSFILRFFAEKFASSDKKHYFCTRITNKTPKATNKTMNNSYASFFYFYFYFAEDCEAGSCV